MKLEIDNRVFSGTAQELWKQLLQVPENYTFVPRAELLKTYEYDDFTAELYIQNNAPERTQKVLKVIPRNLSTPAPAVAVPFYFPEAMLGFDLETLAVQERFAEVAMAAHLARRGFITISAEAYHLTYINSDADRLEWSRWQQSGNALLNDYPHWCGMGKLVADTRLLLDMLENDTRVDKNRIGIAGHSLGGKMAYCAGCLDKRVKVIMASDFGINWNQSNWHDVWYFGSKTEQLKAAGLELWQLLEIANGKPFMLLAGKFDNQESYLSMQKASCYAQTPEKLQIINHATGHRPPADVLLRGYDFLEKFLKEPLHP